MEARVHGEAPLERFARDGSGGERHHPDAGDDPPDAYREIEAALAALDTLLRKRWSPRNPVTRDAIEKPVHDAIRDLRPIVREARALWARLGRHLSNPS